MEVGRLEEPSSQAGWLDVDIAIARPSARFGEAHGAAGQAPILSIDSRTCTGRPRSVMKTGPRRAAFLARLVSWLNSRLVRVVVALSAPGARR